MGTPRYLLKFNEVTSLVILDSGAGVAIATKQIRVSWGQPALRKTRMEIQLADGYVERPMGLLEKVVVSSCNIEYGHTFTMVDFGTKPNYEIILGRPFMRQLKMIQDWGYNYLYLRQPNATTRIDLKDHSFKDVQNTPVKDFETSTMEDTTLSWLEKGKPLWLCRLDKDVVRKRVRQIWMVTLRNHSQSMKSNHSGGKTFSPVWMYVRKRCMTRIIATIRAMTLDH